MRNINQNINQFLTLSRTAFLFVFMLGFIGISCQAQQPQPSPSPLKQAEKQSESKSNAANHSSITAPQEGNILSFKDTDKMFQILEGKWIFGETDCQKAFTMNVSADRKTIKLIYPKSEDIEKKEYIYNVLEVGSYYIRGQYEGEKRLDDNGKPEVWDFFFLSNDEFVWHRSDWEGFNSTKSIIRCNEVNLAPNTKYKVGQMWSYKTRPNEKDSYFIIVKIDADPKLGNIIHIALRNLKMKNPRSSDGFSDKANHLPFSEKSINESAVKILKEKVDLPDFEEGYQMWKEAFDQKRAGVYSITVAEAVDIMEKSLNQ